MKLALTLLLAVSLLLGCSSDKKAIELLETARFEEKQNNRDHAIQLYKEIIQKYPDSSVAATAKTRLQETGQ